jgi:hypothetical protein
MAKKTYEQELLEKKEKLEAILADEIADRNFIARIIKTLQEREKEEGGLNRYDRADLEKSQIDLEKLDLIIECLQDKIYAIYKTLSESNLE